MKTRKADMGVGFIDPTDRRHQGCAFGNPRAGAKTRGAVVAGAGIDFVEFNLCGAVASCFRREIERCHNDGDRQKLQADAPTHQGL